MLTAPSIGVGPFGLPQSDETNLLIARTHREENQGKQINKQTKTKTIEKASDPLRLLGWSPELWALVGGMRDLCGGHGYEGGCLCVAQWELASDRLPKGGQEVFYVWGQTWVGSFQGESGGDSY